MSETELTGKEISKRIETAAKALEKKLKPINAKVDADLKPISIKINEIEKNISRLRAQLKNQLRIEKKRINAYKDEVKTVINEQCSELEIKSETVTLILQESIRFSDEIINQ